MERYLLTVDWEDIESNYIYPSLSATELTQKDILLNRKKPFNDFFTNKDIMFTPLVPKYIDEHSPNQIHTIADWHGWIGRKPKGELHPISKKFATLLQQYQLANHQFYPAQVLFENKLIPYEVFQLDITYYKQLVDYNHSTFARWGLMNKKRLDSKDIFQVNNSTALDQLLKENAWNIGFNKAVMKAAFAQLDMVYILLFGIIISPRLKEAIETANLKGVKITTCPIEFEIATKEELA